MSGIKITPDPTGVDVSTDTISGGVADGDDVQRMKVGYGANGTYFDLEEMPATEATLADVFSVALLISTAVSENSVNAASAPFAQRVDEASPTVTYAGVAAVGALTADPLWRIKKITDSGGDVTVEWADGDALFNNIWDNRASLTYI